MEKVVFISEKLEKIKNKIKKDEFKGRKIINFINTYGVYHFIKTPEFYVSIKKSRQEVLNFIDSFSVAAILNGKRIRGPSFTKAILQDRDIFENNKHFFIGFDEKDLDKISNKFNLKRENLFSHISIYTKTPREREKYIENKEEIKKIAKIINKVNPKFIWVGVSNPRQEIMSKELFPLVSSKYFINVGAAFDFVTGKKKEAPKIIQRIGLEWFYRLVTDFRHTKKKVKRIFNVIIFVPKLCKKEKLNKF